MTGKECDGKTQFGKLPDGCALSVRRPNGLRGSVAVMSLSV